METTLNHHKRIAYYRVRYVLPGGAVRVEGGFQSMADVDRFKARSAAKGATNITATIYTENRD